MVQVFMVEPGGAVNNYGVPVHLPLPQEIIMACMEKQSLQIRP